MNDLEYRVFAKTLENAYSSALLGDEQVLTYIEHLVYLNRALLEPPRRRWPLLSEVALIRRACLACWPERELEIRWRDGLSSSIQVERGELFRPVFHPLLEAADQGVFPNVLSLGQRGGSLEFCLTLGRKVWRQGVVSGE